MGYTDPQDFFQAVIDGQENIWSIVNLTYLFEICSMSFDSGFLVNALLLYLNGVADCASIPGGCAGLLADCSDGSCLPETPICPAPTITQAPATLAIQKICPGKSTGRRPGSRKARRGYPGLCVHSTRDLHLVRANSRSAHLRIYQFRQWRWLPWPWQPLRQQLGPVHGGQSGL